MKEIKTERQQAIIANKILKEMKSAMSVFGEGKGYKVSKRKEYGTYFVSVESNPEKGKYITGIAAATAFETANQYTEDYCAISCGIGSAARTIKGDVETYPVIEVMIQKY